ncbi:MAG: hypothetical protein A2896_02670 [Candidatus Nealsonbacteria bacterium RIFCSPLOWO2_01_FULL_43_32]|uniref:Nudix hydrolase domain-containing protein n=1 Tax=Candidatus Nealsonbacteria bacterium RIFCSPLOWO2_01_FULL_43_32 TaxID=1801672 RepID=A0A1G2EG56_9BACT|nr:MAG: hypothetical protein A2896_02670 [Candidatus Nealsonbacteria bacterium RIFCSPLOWO2_01_FULL_43_32]
MVEHIHEWGDWKKELWYVAGGRYTAEFRKCKTCDAVEARNIVKDERPAVIRPTIGVFAGIFNEEGKVLLRQRLTGTSFAGEWELPGGGVDADNASKGLDERIIIQELGREVKEETGISTPPLLPMAAMYPAVLKSGGDWAFAILVGVVKEKPSKGETRYVSPQELRELAEGPEGNRLLSGWGKRMCRLCLRLLASRDAPNQEYAKQAGEMLAEIMEGWNK